MGRFSAAKMIGAIDTKFQLMFNKLIDLLDTGYMVEKTINGKRIRISIDPQNIIEVLVDDKKVFGVSDDGYVYANRLYDPDDPLAYVQVGKIDATTSMFTLYRKTSSAYTEFRKRLQIYTAGPTATAIEVPVRDTIDTDGSAIFVIKHGDAMLNLWGTFGGGGVSILECGDAEVRTSSSNGPSMTFTPGIMGVDATGPYWLPDGEVDHKPIPDLEEDTFVPTIAGSTVAGTPTYTNQYGFYYVIGDYVFFDYNVAISAIGGMTGNVVLGGLPFTVKNTANRFPAFSVGTFNNVTFPAGANQVVAKGNLNTTNLILSFIQSGGSLVSVAIADIGANFNIRVSGSYRRES